MGLFKKLRDLIDANISDLINKAEDPEKMLNLYVERAAQELKAFNIQVNRAVADELMLRQKIEAAEKEIDSWDAQARTAVQQGRDDLARIALERKQTARDGLEDYRAQLAEQEKAVAELRENYRLLEEKLNRAKAEREQLIIRQRRAKAMKQANEAVKEVAGGSAMADFDRMRDKVARIEAVKEVAGGSAMADFERMRDKVVRIEAEARASRISVGDSLEDEFAGLKKTAAKQNVEDELARLKAELGKGEQ